MTLDQIMKLLDAGYTKEEINEMRDLQHGNPDEKDPDEKDPDEKDPDEKDPDEKDPDEKDPEKHYPDDIAKLTEQVKMLTETMQKHFRDTAEEKKTGVSDGDSILKSILEKGEI